MRFHPTSDRRSLWPRFVGSRSPEQEPEPVDAGSKRIPFHEFALQPTTRTGS
jgi:hypothetical protein